MRKSHVLRNLCGDLTNLVKTRNFSGREYGLQEFCTVCYSNSFSSLGCRLSCQRQKA